MYITRVLSIAILLLFCSAQAMTWRATCKDGSKVFLSECKDNLDTEKAVFKAAFGHAYQGTEIEQIISEKHGSLEHFLDIDFARMQRAFEAHKPNIFFVRAKNEQDEVVGLVSYEKQCDPQTKKDFVYIRKLAVSPNHQAKGIGGLLMYSFLYVCPEVRIVKLMTGRLNLHALMVYHALGLKESEYVHEGVDPQVVVGLEQALDDDFVVAKLRQYECVD